MNSQVLVIGEALIDVVHTPDGLVQNIVGGSPANTAVALSRLGIKTFMKSRTSLDEFGQVIRNYLETEKVDLSLGVIAKEPSTVIKAFIQNDRSAKYEADLIGASDFCWNDKELEFGESNFTFVHLGSLTSYVQPGASEVEKWFTNLKNKTSLLLSFDPNIRHPLDGQKATDVRERAKRLCAISHIVKASDEDFEWIYETNDFKTPAKKLINNGVGIVIITRGKNGAWAISNDKNEFEIPAQDINVIDTIGAGDTFSAAFLAQLIDKGINTLDKFKTMKIFELEEILNNSAHASGVTCSRKGANPPYRNEVNW
jgi:fructokinase